MTIWSDMLSHPNLCAIAEKNTALLESLNFDPAADDPFELDNPYAFMASGLFPEEAIDTIFTETAPDVPAAPSTIVPTIGMVLVRPDMVHAAPDVEAFLGERFSLLEATTVTMTPETYWTLYGDAIARRETRQSRLTRAAVYVGSPCRLFVFERPETKQDTIPAADYIYHRLKGRQGVAQPNTLRGDIVYNAAVQSDFNTLTNEAAARVADPFGAYRKIVAENSISPCQSLTYPLLFFTGVGIHIPNSQELSRDLTALTTSHERYTYTS